MRDQSVAIERDPFVCEVTRFVGKPVEFGPAVIKRLSRLPNSAEDSDLPRSHELAGALPAQGFQRAQDTLLVNGPKMYRHGIFIVWGAMIAAVQTRAS